MKKKLLLIFLLLPFLCKAQGELGFYFQDIKVIPSDYATESKNFEADKKETLHLVRAYIENKETTLADLEKKIDIVDNDRSLNLVDTVIAMQYMALVDSLDDNAPLSDRIKRYLADLGYMSQFYSDRKVGDLDVVTEKVRKKLNDVKRDYELASILTTSQKNIEDDINKAQLQIDNLYSRLYDEGKFKIWITGIFSFIVAALLFFFFLFITRKSDTKLAKDFLSSGNGLQFITLFSLIIAIILFGVLGVLEGRELAAILSGISGYILGKGQNLKGANQGNNEARTALAEEKELK